MGASWLWLFDSIREIDFSLKDFIKESFLVCKESQGGITYQDLRAMTFDDYLETVKYANYLHT